MIRKACLSLMILATLTACVPSWNHTGGSKPPGERNVLESMKSQGAEGRLGHVGSLLSFPRAGIGLSGVRI